MERYVKRNLHITVQNIELCLFRTAKSFHHQTLVPAWRMRLPSFSWNVTLNVTSKSQFRNLASRLLCAKIHTWLWDHWSIKRLHFFFMERCVERSLQITALKFRIPINVYKDSHMTLKVTDWSMKRCSSSLWSDALNVASQSQLRNLESRLMCTKQDSHMPVKITDLWKGMQEKKRAVYTYPTSANKRSQIAKIRIDSMSYFQGEGQSLAIYQRCA